MEKYDKSLRIGNLVLIYNQIEVVTIIVEGEQGGMIIVNRKPILDIKPIPLTKDWLEDFDFTFNENKGHYFKKYYPKGFEFKGFGILEPLVVCEIHKQGGFRVSIAENEDDSGFGLVVINSVHELQNFFFAHSGEELTIKEHQIN